MYYKERESGKVYYIMSDIPKDVEYKAKMSWEKEDE